MQCIQEDGTCEKMFEVFQGYEKRISFDRASLYKFVLGELLLLFFLSEVATLTLSSPQTSTGTGPPYFQLLMRCCTDRLCPSSWSGRFRRLMLSNAAVVKATVFTEFWTVCLLPLKVRRQLLTVFDLG